MASLEPKQPADDAPRTTRAVMGFAFGVVALLVAVAVVYSVEVAVVGMAVVALLAALMRAFAPSRWAFGVRRRPVDVALLLILAGALALLGSTTVLD
jgi:hypothetical protein